MKLPNDIPIELNPEQLSSFHCPHCGGFGFVTVYSVYEVPILYATPPNNAIRVEQSLCVSCQRVVDPARMVKASPEERRAMQEKVANMNKANMQ